MSDKCDQCDKSCGTDGTRCPYCRQTTYCSESCQQAHWVTHHDDCNVIQVTGDQMTAFVPYIGEDMEEQEVVDRLDINGPAYQSYLVNYHSPSGVLKQHVIEPLIGKNVVFQRTTKGIGFGDIPEFLVGETYSINFSINGQEFSLNNLEFKETLFHKDSYGWKGKVASKSGGYQQNNDFVVFHPGRENMKKVRNLEATKIKSSSNISVGVTFQGRTIVQFSGQMFNLFKSEEKWWARAKRAVNVARWMQRFKFDNADLSNLKMLRASDSERNTIVLIFFMPPKATSATLWDMEFRVRTDKFGTQDVEASISNQVTQTFQLDASNVDHMTGLIAAMEEQIADGHLKEFQNTFEMLKEHRERLENDPDYETDLEINAAVHQVTNAMWKNINSGMFASTDYSYAYKHRNDTVEKFKSEVNGLINQLPGTTGKKRWKIKRRLRGIEKAMQDRMRKMERKKNTNTPEYEKLNQLNVMASEALTTSA